MSDAQDIDPSEPERKPPRISRFWPYAAIVAVVGVLAWAGFAQFTFAQRDTKIAGLHKTVSNVTSLLDSTKSALKSTQSTLVMTQKNLAVHLPPKPLTKAQAAHQFAQAMCLSNKHVNDINAALQSKDLSTLQAAIRAAQPDLEKNLTMLS